MRTQEEQTFRGRMRAVWTRGRAAWRAFHDHRTTTIAGMLVFFLIMSLVPFVFWLMLLFGESSAVFDAVLSLELFGWARELILFLQANARGATAGAGIFLLATTLWSSSAFFYHLRRSGEIVYGVRRAGKGWKVRLLAIGMTLLVLLAFAAAGGLMVLLAYLTRALPRAAAYPVLYAALLLLGFLAAWLLNLYVCPEPHRARELAPGSFLTSLAWLLASAAFSVYLLFASKEQLYGALSLVIAFLLWTYWIMICFVGGMIFAKHKITGHPPEGGASRT